MTDEIYGDGAGDGEFYGGDGYDDAGGEPGGLPEGHWGHDADWLRFMDQFGSALQSDPGALEAFQAWMGQQFGEKPPGYGTPGGKYARPFEKQAVELLREENANRRARERE